MASSIAMLKPTPTSSFTRLLRRYLLTAFCLLAYALTWPHMIVDALGSQGLLPFRLPVLLWIPMGYGPAHLSRKLVSESPTAPAGAARDGVRHISSSE
jgi:hypothetical protein